MRIAFHAPLKPPDHPVPSGDRTMARLLIQALRAGGHEVLLASRLRTREADGDRAAQSRLIAQGQQEAAMLASRWADDPPDIWFTYHLYYKAPDLIGPRVSKALNIPYVAAEPSHAPRRLRGPHAAFAARALQAMQGADALICLTERDRQALRPVIPADRLHELKPFLGVRARPPRQHHGPMRLLVVAMMREGDKLASYRLLARALRLVGRSDWCLTIVGDGPARREVQTAFAPFAGQVLFLGQLPPERLDTVHAEHDLYVWPAVNEAYGLAFLQASANGLPIVAGDEGGVSEVVRHGETGLLTPARNPHRLARAIAQLIADRHRFRRLQAGSWRRVERRHRLRAAASALNRIVVPLCRS